MTLTLTDGEARELLWLLRLGGRRLRATPHEPYVKNFCAMIEAQMKDASTGGTA